MLHMPAFEVGQVCIGGLRAALERAQENRPTRARFARTTGVGGFQAGIGGGAEYSRPEQVVTSTTSRSLAGHQVELETSAKRSATCMTATRVVALFLHIRDLGCSCPSTGPASAAGSDPLRVNPFATCPLARLATSSENWRFQMLISTMNDLPGSEVTEVLGEISI